MMMKIPALLVAAVAAWIWPVTKQQPQLFVFHHENVIGTSLEIRLLAGSESAADNAEAAILGEIDRLSGILSTYDSNAEASRWLRTRNQAVPVSPEFLEVLALFDKWKHRTSGALDPAADAIASGVEAPRPVMKRDWKTDFSAGTATHTSNVPLRFHTFVKSYIADRAATVALRTPGITRAIVNIGGDVAIQGPGGAMETVSISNPKHPSETLESIQVGTGMTVATSGTYLRGLHVTDPRTGRSASSIASVTVVAPNAADAGALATSMMILPPEEGRLVAANFVPAAEYLMIAQDGARIASKGWPAMQVRPAAAATTTAVKSGGRKLTLNFELARIDNQRYRRPFVAAWIEDSDKLPVRTVALWFDKPRWLPDLRVWHRGDRMRAMAEGTEIASSVSSATRPPGKYAVDWDGADAQGKPVKPGKYTVCLEVAREHGTYQLIRQEIEINGVPKQFTLPSNLEVAAATIEYR